MHHMLRPAGIAPHRSLIVDRQHPFRRSQRSLRLLRDNRRQPADISTMQPSIGKTL